MPGCQAKRTVERPAHPAWREPIKCLLHAMLPDFEAYWVSHSSTLSSLQASAKALRAHDPVSSSNLLDTYDNDRNDVLHKGLYVGSSRIVRPPWCRRRLMLAIWLVRQVAGLAGLGLLIRPVRRLVAEWF